MFENKNNLESLKQIKFSRAIHKKLSLLLQRDLRNLVTNNLTSITNVTVSPDIKNIDIYFSFLIDAKAEDAFAIIENNKELIKKKLYKAIKNDLQTMPNLSFKLDSSQANIARLDALYNN